MTLSQQLAMLAVLAPLLQESSMAGSVSRKGQIELTTQEMNSVEIEQHRVSITD